MKNIYLVNNTSAGNLFSKYILDLRVEEEVSLFKFALYGSMAGRIQIDMHNYLFFDYNLTSYKLDYVASHFIGDKVKTIHYEESENSTIIKKNYNLFITCWMHI